MEKKNSNSIVLTVIGVATLLVALVGATFAYFSASSTSDPESVQSGHLTISSSLDEADEKDIVPTEWSETMSENDDNINIAKFQYTVNGSGTTVRDAVYDVKLTGTVSLASKVENGVTASDQGGEESDVLYKLVSGESVVAEGNYSQIKTGKQILTGKTLNISGNDTYTLYVFIDETNTNQDKLQGANVSATMEATAYTPKS